MASCQVACCQAAADARTPALPAAVPAHALRRVELVVPLCCELAKPQPAWAALMIWLCLLHTVHDAALLGLADYAVGVSMASQAASLSSRQPANKVVPAAVMAPIACAQHRWLPGVRQLAACVAHCSAGCWRLCCCPPSVQIPCSPLPGRYSMASAFSVLSLPCRALHC